MDVSQPLTFKIHKIPITILGNSLMLFLNTKTVEQMNEKGCCSISLFDKIHPVIGHDEVPVGRLGMGAKTRKEYGLTIGSYVTVIPLRSKSPEEVNLDMQLANCLKLMAEEVAKVAHKREKDSVSLFDTADMQARAFSEAWERVNED